jgi:hypothetical protein
MNPMWNRLRAFLSRHEWTLSARSRSRLARVAWALAAIASLAVASPRAEAQLRKIYTDKNHAIPSFTYTTITLNNQNYTGRFVYSYVYNYVKRIPEWRVTSWAGVSDYTPAKAAQVQAQTATAYNVTADNTLPPTIGLDCHGYSLKNDQVGIFGDNVPTILTDQGYKLIGAGGMAAVGDIVVYKKNGSITHTGVVNAVNGAGTVTQVKSRWGSLGTYTHAINTVPSSYGPAVQVWSAATANPLADPLDPVDLSEYAGIPLVQEEDAAADGEANDYSGASLLLDSHAGGSFSYSLDSPEQGLFFNAGDAVTLYGASITGATVGGSAAAYPWDITTGHDAATGDDFAKWTYEGATSDLLSNLDGFNITSQYTLLGDAEFRETINGSIGLTVGPALVPEPSTLAMLWSGLVAVAMSRRRQRAAGRIALVTR